MTTAHKIIKAIKELPEAEYKKIRDWFVEIDWDTWDKEIEQDSLSGKLDFLMDETNQKDKLHSF